MTASGSVDLCSYYGNQCGDFETRNKYNVTFYTYCSWAQTQRLTTEKLTASLPVASLVTIARKLNQTKASINRGKDNETVLHIHNGIL